MPNGLLPGRVFRNHGNGEVNLGQAFAFLRNYRTPLVVLLGFYMRGNKSWLRKDFGLCYSFGLASIQLTDYLSIKKKIFYFKRFNNY